MLLIPSHNLHNYALSLEAIHSLAAERDCHNKFRMKIPVK
jgi:hypothetical protein